MGVMVPWQQVPMNVREAAHPFKGLVNRARRQCLHIVDIAGDQYVPGSMLAVSRKWWKFEDGVISG